MKQYFFTLRLTITLYLLLFINAWAGAQVENANKLRIITLSPHLSELVFALNKQAYLVAVSDYSDYPEQASVFPSVASYQGANIAEIVRLAPTHILVWRGGNKDADIQKLKSLGFKVHESNISSIDSFIEDIAKLGEFLNAKTKANKLIKRIRLSVQATHKAHINKTISAVYYMNTYPLIGLGNDEWLNDLLSVCGISNIYVDSSSAYPQLQLSHIIRQQPKLIIAATHSPFIDIQSFWQPHSKVLNSHLIQANPDALHRFTLRAIKEINQVCDNAYKE